MIAEKESRSTYSERELQIIKVALELFSRDGFDRVTVKQIAGQCDISEPAVYRYFSSKEILFDVVLDTLKRNWHSDDPLKALATEDEVEQLLWGLANHILKAYVENESACRLLLFSALREKSKARLVYQAIRGTYVQFLKKQLDRLYQQGLIIERHNTITARCFVGMVFDCAMGFNLWKGMQGEVYSAEKVVANNVPIYSRGLKK